MLRNYWKIALVNIRRNKATSLINIFGLALGICSFLFLLQYISLEKSVNQFHAQLPHIYRLINQDPTGNTWSEVEPGWATIAKERFAEIKDYCRFNEETGSTIINKKDNVGESFSEKQTGYADGNFFRFFSFKMLSGETTALDKTNVAFISASTAKKYFGNTDAIDQVLVVNNQFGKTEYVVGGVYADMGDNSDIRYNMLFSLETLKNPVNLNGNDWAAVDNLNSQYINTYFLLNNKVDIAGFETKLNAMRTDLKKDKDGVIFHLQPLSDIHLGSSIHDTYPTTASMKYIYMLGIISFLILIIAWFNYMNLSTAAAIKRANEIGVRKVVGATKKDLVVQFLVESLLLNLFSSLLAIALTIGLQPLFNQLVDKDLSLEMIASSSAWVYAIIFVGAGSLLSGAYVAFALTSYKPVEILKGKISKSGKRVVFRKALVVTQFAVSIALIIVTVVIYTQLNYIQNKKLGLNPEQLLVIRGPKAGADTSLKLSKEVFKNDLAKLPFVSNMATSGSIPSGNYNFVTSGFTQPFSKKGDELKTYAFAIIGKDYLATYQIPIIAGRNFTAPECAVRWNDNNKIMINETALKQFGFNAPQDAVNNFIQWDERKLEVIGVVKDYNHRSLQTAIDPIIFYPSSSDDYYTLRLTPEDMKGKIAQLEKLYKATFSGNPFEYSFIDANYEKLYVTEVKSRNIFTIAALGAIFIACLGLLGLVTFTVAARTKEIGVRKVYGASVPGIVGLLCKSFAVLIFIALLIAVPVSWYLMKNWLNNFAYHISLSWWIFCLAGVISFVLAFVTISFQSIKAALANPIKSLRNE